MATKHTLIVLITILLSGCASSNLETWNTELRSSGYDFRPYTEQGFLFTPEIYNEPYDAVGLVEITYIPRVVEAQSDTRPNQIEGYRIITASTKFYYIELPDTEKLIAEMYELADGLGADALSNFNISNETVYNGNTAIETVKVSGFAIKRLD